jgi:NitT/TauT family transport system permease protein
MFERIYSPKAGSNRTFTWGDLFAFLAIVVLLYLGVRLAFSSPAVIQGPEISLKPQALPWYALFSVARMAAAYFLSLVFSLVYGSYAASRPSAERVLIPLLDILQSVPILSFLPVVLLSLSAVLPENLAVELASVVLIFTSQAWNLTFAWFQSVTTIPKELREAAKIFRLNSWLRFRQLELPFAAISLIWNSMMSWAGGWFFLMAAEIFTLGQRDFRLPGLGSYLQEAANQSDFRAIIYGITTLVLVIILLDQFVWRPLLAWSERFKVAMVESDNPPTSWFYNLMRSSRIMSGLGKAVFQPLQERLDSWSLRALPMKQDEPQKGRSLLSWVYQILQYILILALAYGAYLVIGMLTGISASSWGQIALGSAATFARVLIALILALAWTLPLGVAIGTNPRLAALLQPVVQIAASIPATALFPVFLVFLLHLPAGINLAAILLMLMGTQWYLLFNIIAGASAIPQDLKYTSSLLQLKGWRLWKTLILPALFPYVITGAITAMGGAWNASIVAEHVNFGGESVSTIGIGAIITQATADGDYTLLLAATLSMILVVVLLNRLVWRRLYQLAEEKYRME